MNGAKMILKERMRQINEEGWTPEHDDQHTHGELVEAAVAYALHGLWAHNGRILFPPEWDEQWWKPAKKDTHEMTIKDRIRHLEKAGAMLAAEIDRLMRLENESERTP